MSTETPNPYVGLRPFNDEESLLFFGRGEQTLELLQRLHQHHFVAVVGSSGCGKSSLLRAGLIPSLKAGYLVDNSDRWFIAIMKPGQSPLFNLADALLKGINPNATEAEAEVLVTKIEEEGVDVLIELLTPLRDGEAVNFFLLVDQFEELFRFTMEQNTREQKDKAIDFVNIMLELSNQKILPFYVVLTMRSDFIGDCSEFHGLPEAMNKSLYLVPRLNRQQLKMVIEGPARLYGSNCNSSLTSKLLNKLGKVRDELPLLQHALMRMWDFEVREDKNGELDHDDYKAIGGIELALSIHADEALKTLSKDEFQIAKVLFQALTTIDDHGRKTRRPARYSLLKEVTGASDETLKKVIHAFIDNKRSFLIINEIPGQDDKLIDISHESLIRQWKRLDRWVDKESEAASVYIKLSQDMRLYKDDQKDLLDGRELEIAWNWFNSFEPTEAWAQRYDDDFEQSILYLKESEAVREAKEKAARRKVRKRKYLVRTFITAGVLILLLIAIIFSASYARRTAIEEIMGNANNIYQKKDLSGYYDVVKFIGSQKDLYKNAKVVDSLGEIKFDPENDTLVKPAQDLRVKAIEKIDSIERTLDVINWEAAVASAAEGEKIKSYTDYLTKSSRVYRNTSTARHLQQARDSLEKYAEDQAWSKASSYNTVTAYLAYIEYMEENTMELSEETIATRIDNANTKINEIRRTGWLYSGRINSSDDRVFRVLGGGKNSVPEIGDVVKAQSTRSVYNDFTGNAVINRKGAILREDNLARVLDKEIVGGAIFLNISY